MADTVREAHQEFWRPPLNQPAAAEMAEACRRCGTEFMVGAAFCHICGQGRHRSSTADSRSWTTNLGFLNALEFGNVPKWFTLPVTPLIPFPTAIPFLLIPFPIHLAPL